jgi:hypothetical protein
MATVPQPSGNRPKLQYHSEQYQGHTITLSSYPDKWERPVGTPVPYIMAEVFVERGDLLSTIWLEAAENGFPGTRDALLRVLAATGLELARQQVRTGLFQDVRLGVVRLNPDDAREG